MTQRLHPPAAPDYPLVTVVIATRDRPEDLRASVAAVLAQDYAGPLEVIVVYDQSLPDEALAESGKGRVVRVMTNQRTAGLAGARNTGILAGSGDLVAFCDDDDVWLPTKLSRQVDILTSEEDTDFVACGIQVSYDGTTTQRVLTSHTIVHADLLRSRLTELHPSTFCMRRHAVLEGFGLVDETIPGSYAEDYDFLLRAASHAPLRTVPAALVEVRWHAQSYFTARWDTISAALGWLLDAHPDFTSVPHGYARIAGQIAFADAARGQRHTALRWTARTLRANPREPRGWLALVVLGHLARPETVVRRLNARGRGI